MRVGFILTVVAVFSFYPVELYAQTPTELSQDEKLELQIYRDRMPALKEELGRLRSSASDTQAMLSASYVKYLASVYQEETELRQLRVSVFRWQIFAANWILALVVLLTVAGVAFAGFQLWVAAKASATGSGSIDLEVSATKVRLQSSVIGLAVLVISGVFLILFLNEVYKIDVIRSSSDVAKEQPMATRSGDDSSIE